MYQAMQKQQLMLNIKEHVCRDLYSATSFYLHMCGYPSRYYGLLGRVGGAPIGCFAAVISLISILCVFNSTHARDGRDRIFACLLSGFHHFAHTYMEMHM